MIYSLFGAIAGGILLGYLCFDVSDKPALDTTLMTALNFMILVAGIEIGGNRKLIAKICTPKNMVLALALPVGTIIGSFAGGYLSSFITGLNVYDSILVASGLGWYSLSSVVISTMHSTELMPTRQKWYQNEGRNLANHITKKGDSSQLRTVHSTNDNGRKAVPA